MYYCIVRYAATATKDANDEPESIGMLFNSQQDEDAFFAQMSIGGESMKGSGHILRFEETGEIITTVYLFGENEKGLNVFQDEDYALWAVDSNWIYPDFIRQGDRDSTDKTLLYEFAQLLMKKNEGE